MTSTGTQATETPQRCSDAEREQASALVREATAEGRLSMAELEERLSTIYAARYRHELAAVCADLPQPMTRAGWAAVLALAWHQLTSDLTGLVGRGGATLSRRRKVVLVLTLLVTAMLVIGLVTALMHGLFDADGPEHPDFGEH
jgi:hypothetical protein